MKFGGHLEVPVQPIRLSLSFLVFKVIWSTGLKIACNSKMADRRGELIGIFD